MAPANWTQNENVFVFVDESVSNNFDAIYFNLDAYERRGELKELQVMEDEEPKYNGRQSSGFLKFLSRSKFRINCQGRVAVPVPQRDDRGNYLEDFNFFLIRKLVDLQPYGITNVPFPKNLVNPIVPVINNNAGSGSTTTTGTNDAGPTTTSNSTSTTNGTNNTGSTSTTGTNNAGPTSTSTATGTNNSTGSTSTTNTNNTGGGTGSNDQVTNVTRLIFVRLINPDADFSGFLRSIANKVFVNGAGEYYEFKFRVARVSGSPFLNDNTVYYYNSRVRMSDPFTEMQYATPDENPAPITSGGQLSAPSVSWDMDMDFYYNILIGYPSYEGAFVYKDLCLTGTITKVLGPTFFNDVAIRNLLNLNKGGVPTDDVNPSLNDLQEYRARRVFADQRGTTYFTFNTRSTRTDNKSAWLPKVI